MSTAALKAMETIVEDYALMPGWRMRIRYASASLLIEARVPDSTRPDHPLIKVETLAQIPRPLLVTWTGGGHDVLEFRHFLERVVRKAWLHELDEFLRYRGELVHDPHAYDTPF